MQAFSTSLAKPRINRAVAVAICNTLICPVNVPALIAWKVLLLATRHGDDYQID